MAQSESGIPPELRLLLVEAVKEVVKEVVGEIAQDSLSSVNSRVEALCSRVEARLEFGGSGESFGVPLTVPVFPKPPQEKTGLGNQMIWTRLDGEDYPVTEHVSSFDAGQCVSGRVRSLHLARFEGTRGLMIIPRLDIQVSPSHIYSIGLGSVHNTTSRMCLTALKNATPEQLRGNIRAAFLPGTDDRVVLCNLQDSRGQNISCAGAASVTEGSRELERMVWNAFCNVWGVVDPDLGGQITGRTRGVLSGEFESTQGDKSPADTNELAAFMAKCKKADPKSPSFHSEVGRLVSSHGGESKAAGAVLGELAKSLELAEDGLGFARNWLKKDQGGVRSLWRQGRYCAVLDAFLAQNAEGNHVAN